MDGVTVYLPRGKKLKVTRQVIDDGYTFTVTMLTPDNLSGRERERD